MLLVDPFIYAYEALVFIWMTFTIVLRVSVETCIYEQVARDALWTLGS